MTEKREEVGESVSGRTPDPAPATRLRAARAARASSGENPNVRPCFHNAEQAAEEWIAAVAPILAPKAALYTALIKAQGEARALTKASEADCYKYVSSERIIEEAKRVLGIAGLALFQIGGTFVPNASGKREAIGQRHMVGRIAVVYRLVHGESGQYEDCTESLAVVVSRGRPDDKAESTSKTMALAYFLRTLLLIPREDEPETAIDKRNDSELDADEDDEPSNTDRSESEGPAQGDPVTPFDDAPDANEREEREARSAAEAEKRTWEEIARFVREKIKGARRAADVAEAIADARAIRGMPAGVLAAIETYALEIDEIKKEKRR